MMESSGWPGCTAGHLPEVRRERSARSLGYRPFTAQIPIRREMRARAAIPILAQVNSEAQESTSLPARPTTSEALWASRNAYSTMVWPGSENTGGDWLALKRVYAPVSGASTLLTPP